MTCIAVYGKEHSSVYDISCS